MHQVRLPTGEPHQNSITKEPTKKMWTRRDLGETTDGRHFRSSSEAAAAAAVKVEQNTIACWPLVEPIASASNFPHFVGVSVDVPWRTDSMLTISLGS